MSTQKQEACQLYIEQEIESGLEKGATPYSIGKEIASWVERLFEAKIPPRTIEQRARRQKAENATNVANPIKQTLTSVENEILTQASEIRKDRKIKQAETQEQLKGEIIKEPLPDNKYQTIVIDPPWPIQKILRDDRPNQGVFDYPTMSIEEITRFPISDVSAHDCHLYLWATHKFMPVAFLIMEAWGFRYQCLMTWVKNVGMTPFSWMYSTEHCLFGRKGNLDLLKKGKRLDFNAKVREHSRKPDEFYNLIKEVSPEPRIDIFSREKREGFSQYGNQEDRF